MAQLAALTADQILTQFESLIDDSLDQTTELFLLNQVKDTLESSRAWEYLKKLDKSVSATTSDTYLTTHPLPADFAKPSERGIYVGTDLIAYKQVPFESQIRFQSITYAYYIDFFNSVYALCGKPGQNGTVYFFYQATSAALALATNGGLPWIFPARFHPILPYLMARKYFAIDQGDKGRAWDDRWTGFMQEMLDQMNAWDTELQSIALANEQKFGAVDLGSYPSIVDMDQGAPGGMYG